MIEPAAFDPEKTPAAVLAGRAWPIPELVWRDLRRCRQELLELNGRINDAVKDAAAAKLEDKAAERGRQLGVMAQVFNDLDNDDFDRLVMGPIYAGLVAAHPELTREEFYGWRLTEEERQMAWLVVRRQSGIFVFTGDAAPGEGEGAA